MGLVRGGWGPVWEGCGGVSLLRWQLVASKGKGALCWQWGGARALLRWGCSEGVSCGDPGGCSGVRAVVAVGGDGVGAACSGGIGDPSGARWGQW